MFARVLGPFLVIVDVTAVVRASDMRGLLSDFVANPLWAWVAGAFILLGGLTIVGLHQCWRGAAVIIVSLVGWLVGAAGVFLLAFPQTFVSVANSDRRGGMVAGDLHRFRPGGAVSDLCRLDPRIQPADLTSNPLNPGSPACRVIQFNWSTAPQTVAKSSSAALWRSPGLTRPIARCSAGRSVKTGTGGTERNCIW